MAGAEAEAEREGEREGMSEEWEGWEEWKSVMGGRGPAEVVDSGSCSFSAWLFGVVCTDSAVIETPLLLLLLLWL